MKAPNCLALSTMLVLLTFPPLADQASAQNNVVANSTPACGEAVQVRALLEEVRALRALVGTWKLETQSERRKALEQAMETLRAEKMRLQHDQRSAEQQLAGIEAQIRSVAAGSEQHMQLEAERLLTANSISGYQQRFSDFAAREAELDQQLSVERRRTTELREQLGGITTLR